MRRRLNAVFLRLLEQYHPVNHGIQDFFLRYVQERALAVLVALFKLAQGNGMIVNKGNDTVAESSMAIARET